MSLFELLSLVIGAVGVVLAWLAYRQAQRATTIGQAGFTLAQQGLIGGA